MCLPHFNACLMEMCLRELQLTWCIIYLVDTMVFAETPEVHAMVEVCVFKPGCKLKPNRCEFFHREIAYLGHIVSQEEVRTDEWKIKAVCDWPK